MKQGQRAAIDGWLACPGGTGGWLGCRIGLHARRAAVEMITILIFPAKMAQA
ncbi:hypothetical protein HNQ60_005266 [Povalibacter uvarum]|uniref:Uncharacterized protein n=1 Tax=Povalibacter uvarum TaxID=732238 RepID=A0A841HUL8_9GAMM|nr:hypothetical protein [Povalibacter uvarum]MBB6096344.1 hypothetical protein [Povalibacter uvarum]